MLKRILVPVLIVACVLVFDFSFAAKVEGRKEFKVGSGGLLEIDLESGGSIDIRGTGGSSIIVEYSKRCDPECEISFNETAGGLKISSEFVGRGRNQSSNIELEIQVPSIYDVKLESMGGGISIEGVDGTFRGKTMGGEMTLHDVRGEAKLVTMGGKIKLTDSELDGSLKTMGGEVLFENVIGNVKGSSMGGDVRYKNVQRRDGDLASPPNLGDDLDDTSTDTVQVSTMGGKIEVEDAPEGADVHTMGGDIEISDAQRFVRAKTMGGDIRVDSVDGWIQAITMGGDIDVQMVGSGGDVLLSSKSGSIELCVPSRFGMQLELEVAFTRNSSKQFKIDTPGKLAETVSPDWDYDHGSPRKFLRQSGTINGGGNSVKIETINGDITVKKGC
jgi:DUF4097 and DUF4098 domain-containing protein YvlB